MTQTRRQWCGKPIRNWTEEDGMDKFYIITNSDKDKNLEITKKIENYLKQKGKECQVQLAERKQEGS